jgi:hypothetical protein
MHVPSSRGLRLGFSFCGCPDDQSFGSAVEVSSTSEKIDVIDAETAQGSLDPSWYVQVLSVGDLLGGLRCHRLATMP